MINAALPKVSIIIPTLNEAENLPACLDSLTNVDYPKDLLEIIVVDNGSTDATREIAGAYATKVLLQSSGNVAALRNFGAKHSTGAILAFVDGDCVVDRNWLKNASTYFDDANVAAWGGPPIPPDNSSWIAKIWYLVVKRKERAQEVNWLGTVDLFVRKNQFISVGGFSESLITCEDVDLCLRLKKLGSIVYDEGIRIVHLREPSTLKQFIKKEIWRGRGNLKGVLRHGIQLNEIPSLSVPLYFGLLLPVIVLAAVLTSDRYWFIAMLALYLLPTVLVIIKVLCKRIQADFFDLLRLSALLQLYFLARTAALFRFGKD